MVATRKYLTCVELYCATVYSGKTHNPLPNDKVLDSSKLKEFADDNFELDENGRKFSKRVENAMGKTEIAHYERFLLFPQCFLKAYNVDM